MDPNFSMRLVSLQYSSYYAGYYQYGSYRSAVSGPCVTGSSYGDCGPVHQNYGNTQENLDFAEDYDDDSRNKRNPSVKSKVVVPYRQNNGNRSFQRTNNGNWYPQQTNRYLTSKYHNQYQNRYNGYALLTRDPQRRNYSHARSITCFTCGELFSNKTALYAHKDVAHTKRNYYCPVCNKQFSVLRLMKEHEKTHTIQACPECPEIFKFKDSLIAHKEHAHGLPPRTEEPSKSDPSIDKSSGFKNFISPVAASTPAASFSEPSQVESQSSDKLSCPFCIKKFSTRRELTLHLDSAHTKVYYCRSCSAEYSTQIELDAHSKVHI